VDFLLLLIEFFR